MFHSFNICLAIAALLAMNTIPVAPTQAAPAPNDAMRFADTARGREISKDPSVIFFAGKYWMYYSLGPWVNNVQPPQNLPADTWTVGIASSTDLVNWTKVGELLPHGDYGNGFIEKGLAAPCARVLDGRVQLFYQSYGGGPKDAICHAVSTDGVNFTRDQSNPIYHPTGSWTVGRAIDADVFPVGDKLMLYFATRDQNYKIQKIGVASAPLASDFARDQWKPESIGSILLPELDWEKDCIEAPSVIEHQGKLFMFYAGAYNNEPQQIGVAKSSDGINWQRLFTQPFLPNGTKGSWNESESGHPGIFADPQTGRTWLFFQGNNDKGATWYLSKVEVFWRDGLPSLTK